jgi:hypothetical protein
LFPSLSILHTLCIIAFNSVGPKLSQGIVR